MKLDVMRPRLLSISMQLDKTALGRRSDTRGLRLGARPQGRAAEQLNIKTNYHYPVIGGNPQTLRPVKQIPICLSLVGNVLHGPMPVSSSCFPYTACNKEIPDQVFPSMV